MKLRNVAIIAHVDHGKTTLVDALLRQSKTKMDKEQAQATCIMDSNELEKERGITIFSKNASVIWRDTKINIIDTPGHADFGGEVERVLKMADGCLLLVDAKEGPMPQTRFVLKRALEMKLKIIVVINKIDKPGARPDFALDKTFDLFLELGADDASADFPIIYAASKLGQAGLEPELDKMKDITPIFDAILKYVPAPSGDENQPLQMLVTMIGMDNYRGRLATGRIYNGKLTAGQTVAQIQRSGDIKKFKLTALMSSCGLSRQEVAEAPTGDVVTVAGIPEINIGETIADPENPKALPLLAIEEPTVKMTFRVNDSPFGGREGKFVTSRQLRDRLYKELQTDMALRVADLPDGTWEVSGRGELHLAILLERLRREGFELQVSRPQVITKKVKGQTLTPYERLTIEVPEKHSGVVLQKLGQRHAELQDMKTENGVVYLEFLVPTRGLFGYRGEFLTDTHGLGIMHATFQEYLPDPETWPERDHGSLVTTEAGLTNLYGLLNVQQRGILFVGPAVEVYLGQVVGQNSRPGDLPVNVCKTKKLSNMRSKGDGTNEHFDTPHTMGLEDALEYIGDDELVEITPKNIRIRKMTLDKQAARRKELGIKE